ncbi:hypothetical protein KCU77_g4964, partial [Aureobasidium melanogenum]
MQGSEDVPYDPNHATVIYIESDDEKDDDDDEFRYDGGFSSEPEGASQERSSYFKPNAEVEAFNARFSQSLAAPKAAVPPNRRAARAGSGGAKYGDKKGAPRRPSYGKGKSAAGVAAKKRAPAAKKQSNLAAKFSFNNNAGSSKRGGGGGGGTSSGIGMMPL